MSSRTRGSVEGHNVSTQPSVLILIDIVQYQVDHVETRQDGRGQIQVLNNGLGGIIFAFNRVR